MTSSDMPKGKKAKRSNLVTICIQIRPEEHRRISQLVEHRGHPHNMATVAAEMISRGLMSESP